MHYITSIAKAMKGSGDDYELDDDDDDYKELSELEEVQDEQVRIWLDGLPSGREIMSSFDFTTENKGNVDMLADYAGSCQCLNGTFIFLNSIFASPCHLASQGLSNSELPCACKISIVPNKDCGVNFVKLSRSCVTFNLKLSKTDKHSIWLILLLYHFDVYQWYKLITLLQIQT